MDHRVCRCDDTRFEVGDDCKTAYERLQGRTFTKELVVFGDKLIYEVHGVRDGGKIDKRFWSGIFVGIWTNSHGYLVADADDAVVKTNTIKRKLQSERWDIEAVKNITGVPWETGERSSRASRQGEMQQEKKEAVPQVQEPIEPMLQLREYRNHEACSATFWKHSRVPRLSDSAGHENRCWAYAKMQGASREQHGR